MERPEYQLDFEVKTYFNAKADCEATIWDGSRIVFCKSEGTNKGFIIYQMDTLNHGEAKEEGTKRVNAFLNYLMIASNIDNIKPTVFAESPKLLNSDKFKGMTMTITKTLTANSILVANFQKQWVEYANILSSKIHKLMDNEQSAIDRCLFWLRKGAEATSNERFICRWVSLEALSGVLDEQFSSTERLVNSLINKLRNESAKTLFERNEKLLEQFVIASLDGWKNQKRSDELKRAISTLEKNGDYKAVMMKTALCIYEVRNKFLHRGEAMSLINGCNTLLRELIHALLKDLVQNT
jgi:hypothetical protein